MGAYIDHLAVALGSAEGTVASAEARGLLFSTSAALETAGFARHFTCPQGESAYDLALRAARQVPGAPRAGAIVYACCIPVNENLGDAGRFRESGDVKYLMDFPASHLQADLGASGAFVVGISQQACTGMLGSLRIAHGLLATDPALDNVLCVTADRFPEGAKYEQSYALISDGAACCMVSRAPGAWKLVGCHAVTNGALALSSDDETVGAFFTWMHRAITETLARCGLFIGDIAWIVPQNMNVKAWQILARLLGIAYERVAFPALAEVGHVISADNMINLMRLEQSGQVKRGDKVLLPMAGYGLNWQCVVLERA